MMFSYLDCLAECQHKIDVKQHKATIPKPKRKSFYGKSVANFLNKKNKQISLK